MLNVTVERFNLADLGLIIVHTSKFTFAMPNLALLRLQIPVLDILPPQCKRTEHVLLASSCAVKYDTIVFLLLPTLLKLVII